MGIRNYKLKDIYDYLLKYYNLKWLSYKIKDVTADKIQERSVRGCDFHGKKQDHLYVIAIMNQGAKHKTVSLSVTNDKLELYEINPYMHYYNKPEIEWKEFLSSQYNQENGLNRYY